MIIDPHSKPAPITAGTEFDGQTFAVAFGRILEDQTDAQKYALVSSLNTDLEALSGYQWHTSLSDASQGNKMFKVHCREVIAEPMRESVNKLIKGYIKGNEVHWQTLRPRTQQRSSQHGQA